MADQLAWTLKQDATLEEIGPSPKDTSDGLTAAHRKNNKIRLVAIYAYINVRLTNYRSLTKLHSYNAHTTPCLENKNNPVIQT